MSNVRIFTRINKSRQVTPSLPLSSEEQLPVINPNPTGQAIRHNSTLDKNGGDSDNDYYGHNTEDIQEALEGSNLPSVINVFATIEDFNDYVTLNTEQEITGKKIFNADLIVGDPSLDYLGWSKLAKTFGIFSQAQFIHKYRGGAAGALNIGQFDVNGNASINNTSNAGISIGTNNIQRIGIEANGDVLLKKVDNGVGDFVRINASTGKLTKRTVAEVTEDLDLINEPEEIETNVVIFDDLSGYIIGNASARTGNVTFDFTSEKLFSVTRMLHNSGTIPTFPAEGKIINGEYKVSVDNFLWLCLTKKTTGRIVEITIGQV